MIESKQWFRPASSGLEDILSRSWLCAKPRAIIQLVHGMAEHSARYDEFARFLAGHGFAVYMNEHAGHGQYAKTLGYFAERDGMTHLVRDMKALMDEATAEYSGLPVFLLGHSMGSFLTRKYIAQYGNTLSGCILSGTAGKNPAIGLGILLASLQKKIKGAKSSGKLLMVIAFGSYTKRIQNPVNRCAWLSTADDVCVAFVKDEYCSFPFTAGGYYDLFTLLKEINLRTWFASVPKDLPVYLFSGEDDPVGGYGKGVTEVYERLKDIGIRDLELKLYAGRRHEMLNETNRHEVYEDILAWIATRCVGIECLR